MHDVPSPLFTCEHAPPEQLSVVHSLPSSHDAQSAPPAPHAGADVPAPQPTPGVTHPVQHAPVRHCPVPPLHEVPSANAGCEQAPPPQESSVHSIESSQFAHAAPAVPHDAIVLPVRHELPLTQPVQHAPVRHFPPEHAEPLPAFG